MKVDVVTRSIDNPEEVNRRQIDYSKHDARVWLSKHCMWAMCNRHSVTTSPAEVG